MPPIVTVSCLGSLVVVWISVLVPVGLVMLFVMFAVWLFVCLTLDMIVVVILRSRLFVMILVFECVNLSVTVWLTFDFVLAMTVIWFEKLKATLDADTRCLADRDLAGEWVCFVL